jgi:translation elongation factor EF-4
MLHPQGWTVFLRRKGTQHWVKQSVLSSRQEAQSLAQRLVTEGKELVPTQAFSVPVLKKVIT